MIINLSIFFTLMSFNQNKVYSYHLILDLTQPCLSPCHGNKQKKNCVDNCFVLDTICTKFIQWFSQECLFCCAEKEKVVYYVQLSSISRLETIVDHVDIILRQR